MSSWKRIYRWDPPPLGDASFAEFENFLTLRGWSVEPSTGFEWLRTRHVKSGVVATSYINRKGRITISPELSDLIEEFTHARVA